LTEFRLSVSNENAEAVELAIRAIIGLLTMQNPVNESGDEEYSSVEEVLGPRVPGDILQGFRYREGLTQKQLADAVGVKQNHISEMERGTRKISLNMAKRFAEFFHTSEKAFI
jgi:DNA-binding XRE family transcriptional regulator